MPHHSNLQPFLVVFDPTLKMSTVGSRLYEPLVTVRGRFPKCGWGNAVVCPPNAPRMYGAKDVTYLHNGDSDAPRCDPAVRMRLADLLAACPVLREEIKRRSKSAEAAQPLDLVTRTFGKTLTSNV